MSVVALRNVTKSFKDATILRNVNLDVEAGTIVGIVGRNGSGKTILLKIICGLMLPTSGTVCVHGDKIAVDRDFSASTGVLIETPEFLPYQTGYQNLHALSHISYKINDTEIRNIISQVGLDPKSRKPVGKYSLGMRQRLGIAQAIMEHPKLLLLDEPMNGLDAQGAKEMRQLFRGLQRDGTTIILATHIKEDMEGICEQVYTIENGTLRKLDENCEA